MPSNSKQIIQPFISYLQYEKRYSANTITSYSADLSEFFAYLNLQFGNTLLKDINHIQIRSWLAGLKDKGLTSKSINRKISSLKSFFKYCVRTEMLKNSPMTKIISPKIGKRLPVFVNEEETKKLVDTLNNSAETWKSLNAKMLITIFYNTGMRLSELISLKEKQIDFSRSSIKVLGKGNKERVIPVNKETIENIRHYQELKNKELETSEDFLLVTEKGKKLYPKYAYLLVNQYLGTVGTLDKKSPHVLRHTFATHLMNNGADLNAVKELLGHNSLASTQVYTHNSIEKLKDIHKKAHPKA
ncbi:integrase [Chitinophagaceae bacterium IBVUCB2]|nr:integrase [Chitinophagaceae bacterium IBVUCB2]